MYETMSIVCFRVSLTAYPVPPSSTSTSPLLLRTIARFVPHSRNKTSVSLGDSSKVLSSVDLTGRKTSPRRLPTPFPHKTSQIKILTGEKQERGDLPPRPLSTSLSHLVYLVNSSLHYNPLTTVIVLSLVHVTLIYLSPSQPLYSHSDLIDVSHRPSCTLSSSEVLTPFPSSAR